jgi:hypothetical protein
VPPPLAPPRQQATKTRKHTQQSSGYGVWFALVRTRLFWLSCFDFDFVVRSVITINNSNQQQATKLNNKLQQK